MAESAFQRQYRQEFIAGFEDRQSILRSMCVQEAQVRGNEAIFLVADSGGASAVTRGVNGLIPARADNLTQNTCTIYEYHDLVRKTEFNILSSQGDQRRIMQETSMGTINRRIDNSIIAALDTATNNPSATAQVASIDLVVHAQTILGNNQVPIWDEDNLFAVVSPAFNGYMMQTPEYASADYVEVKPFTGPARRFRRFMGFNWSIHGRLTNSVGAGGTGASEQCFFFHRNSIGSAVHKDGISTAVGFDEEQAYSFCRSTVHIGAALLQNSGVVQVLHDASGYAAV